jgi:SET domain-containing protein
MQLEATENPSILLDPEQLVQPLNRNLWRCTKPAICSMPVYGYTFNSSSNAGSRDVHPVRNVLDRQTSTSNTSNGGKRPEGMQHRVPTLSLYLEEVPPKGLGVFCKRCIFKDECVTEYTGEVLLNSSELLQTRCYSRKKTLNTYQMPLWSLYTIDCTQYGNYGRYFNHSHDPNCYT